MPSAKHMRTTARNGVHGYMTTPQGRTHLFTLKLGMEGGAVRLLQQRLAALGLEQQGNDAIVDVKTHPRRLSDALSGGSP